ncbi:uncharacterized protein BO97DRAFT_366268, partial [Aspergillus homomorphus CBS 101889]
MTVIAVAGGTGAVGQTIIETLLQETTHEIIILTRSTSNQTIPTTRTKHLQIDYTDIASLAETLTTHAITTIISAIGITDAATSQAQLNLISAAERSSTVSRFIPSEYSFIQTEDLLPIDPSIEHWLVAARKLQESQTLKYTRMIPGFFMDYWGMPHVQTHLEPYVFGIDIAHCRAAIPGDGNDKLCMTYTYDMAKYLVKLLEVDGEWPECSVVVGDTVTYNQLLGVAEEVRGREFSVVYDSAEKIKQGQVTVPAIPPGSSEAEAREMTALVSRLTIAGVFDLPADNRLNARFPEIVPVKVKDLLVEAWR